MQEWNISGSAFVYLLLYLDPYFLLRIVNRARDAKRICSRCIVRVWFLSPELTLFFTS